MAGPAPLRLRLKHSYPAVTLGPHPNPTPTPGAVLTIEPGLYIPDDEAFGRLRGIGVRIEDDVTVTGGSGRAAEWFTAGDSWRMAVGWSIAGASTLRMT